MSDDINDVTDAEEVRVGSDDTELASEPDELTRLAQERAELVETLQRMQADFDNLRKRMQRDQQVAIERAAERIVDQLLPVLDNFQLALTSLEADEHGQLAADKVRKGIELVFADFVSVLEKAGLERIEAHGEVFDPTLHEAVLEVEGEGGEATVVDIMRAGYVFKGRVLRPAMVKVAR
ncbi:MAG: nucleotide exchange factor GrpE [Acidimicrobiia bacterium]